MTGGIDTPKEPTETLFDSEPWRQAIEQSFDLKILSYTPSCEPTAVGWYSTISDLRGERVVATPFSDYCDPSIETEAGWAEFVAYLRSHNRPLVIRPFTNPLALADPTMEHRQELLWHGVDLSEGADRVWDGLKTKLRTTIRRAPKTGLRFRCSSAMEDVAIFHAMHVDLRKSKYRMMAQPLRFFEALHDRFEDDMVVVLAEEDDGTPVASMIYFAWKGVWYYKFSASYPRRYRPNAAMLMEACREGADRGLTLLDMGRSDRDQPGLVEFKQQFASEERLLTTLHWSPDDWENPNGVDAGRTLGCITRLLTSPEVPNQVTADGADLLYRYFA